MNDPGARRADAAWRGVCGRHGFGRGGAGAVTFTASGGNAPGVTTELLLNALASRNRTPEARAYRHKAFAAFNSGLTATPGWYVPAYRFVNTERGGTWAWQFCPRCR